MDSLDRADSLTREDLLEIIHCIPDSIRVYDRDGNILIHSNTSAEYQAKYESATGALKAQIEESRQALTAAVRSVLDTGKPATLIHMEPHFKGPSLFTIRPVFDESGKVRYAVLDGRSQAVINKFSTEYVKLEQQLKVSQESIKLLSQLRLKSADIVAESPGMKQVLMDVSRIAQTESTVTITGESGTGKEVIANAIHQNSPRKDGLFVPVNCSAIPPELMESEFFGYASGAFTGARAGGSAGLFELANHGTLFLDEVGDLPLSLQPKLLRALESGEIRPVGSNKAKRVDVRIIAATNRDLDEMVRAQEFRQDLYYRLQIIPIHIPPLRSRREDVIPLCEHYLQFYNKKHRRHCYLTDDAKAELLRYGWPGNVRELRNLMERLVITSEMDALSHLRLLHSRSVPPQDSKPAALPRLAGADDNYYRAVEQFERAYIEKAILTCGGNVAAAAERMGVHKSMVYKKLQKFKENGN